MRLPVRKATVTHSTGHRLPGTITGQTNHYKSDIRSSVQGPAPAGRIGWFHADQVRRDGSKRRRQPLSGHHHVHRVLEGPSR
jgi:hypothetical protein